MGSSVILTQRLPSTMANKQFTVDMAQEFHRRMAAIIAAVQAGVWHLDDQNLLGYATDFAFGQERGRQTLVLKTRGRSAYLRLQWDTLLSDSAEDKQLVAQAVHSAITELA